MPKNARFPEHVGLCIRSETAGMPRMEELMGRFAREDDAA